MNEKVTFLILFIFAIFTILFFSYKNENGSKDTAIRKFERKSLANHGKIELEITANCSASFAVWIVTSYASNREKRNRIRQSYSSEELDSLGIQRVFLLGKISQSQDDNENSTVEESDLFHDIVQGHFIEAYRNLTYKHLMGLTWVAENCPGTVSVMKTDDDIIINMYDIIELLKQKVDNFFIMGHALTKMVPVREPQNKWFVTKSEFAESVFPDFVSGWFYITNKKTVEKLVNQSKRLSSFFWIDDVFVSGILRQELAIEIIDIREKFTTDYRFAECCIDGGFKKHLKCEFLAGPDGAQNDLVKRFAEFSKFCRGNQCSERQANNSVGKTCVWTYKEQKNFSAPGNAVVEVLST